MKLENFIALRYLKSRKNSRLMSFMSGISVLGILLGVATLIVVISVMNGFSDNLKNKILGANAHIVVNRMDVNPISKWDAIETAIRTKDGIEGVSPFIINQVLVTSHKNVSGVVVRGVQPLKEESVTSIRKFMVEGEFTDIDKESEKPGIAVGKELAAQMGVMLGDEVVVVSPFGKKGPFGFTPKMKKFDITGIFDTGMYEYNTSLAYISLKNAQDFFGTGDIVTGFSVKVENFDDAVQISKGLRDELGFPYWARDWLSMNASLFSALKLEKIAMFIILTLIIIVASFNIVSMISISVKDKSREIAILRAMGASEKVIYKIFQRQGVIIGVAGTLIGNIIGFAICYLLKNYKIIELPQDVYFMDKIPVVIDPYVFLTVSACSIAITYIAGYFPAKHSARLDPIEALRQD